MKKLKSSYINLITGLLIACCISLGGCSDSILNGEDTGFFGFNGLGLDSPVQVSDGGVRGSGVIMGTVTQRVDEDHIIVNETTINTSEAVVIINNEISSSGLIEVGMYVNAEVTYITGSDIAIATQIIADSVYEGKIENIDNNEKRIILFGQSITIDDSTNFSQGDFSDLKIGQRVLVNAYKGKDNNLLARTLENLSALSATPYFSDLYGEITDLDSENKILVLDGYTIDYAKAGIYVEAPVELYVGRPITVTIDGSAPKKNVIQKAVSIFSGADPSQPKIYYTYYIDNEYTFQTPAPGTISGILKNINQETFNIFEIGRWDVFLGEPITQFVNLDYVSEEFISIEQLNGLYVNIYGAEFTWDISTGGIMFALIVGNLDFTANNSAGDYVEVRGYVTSVNPDGSLQLSNSKLPMTIDTNTQFEGLTADEIQAYTNLEIQGIITSENKIAVSQIRKLTDSSARIEALVEAVDTSVNSINLSGVPILIDDKTIMIDAVDQNSLDFDLNKITTGDRVIAYGEEGEDGFVASRIERIELSPVTN